MNMREILNDTLVEYRGGIPVALVCVGDYVTIEPAPGFPYAEVRRVIGLTCDDADDRYGDDGIRIVVEGGDAPYQWHEIKSVLLESEVENVEGP